MGGAQQDDRSGTDPGQVFAAHHRRLVALAYRSLGRMTEAEDAAQETFLRWQSADREAIEDPGAWLTTVCTRICLDRLRSAAHRRETYPGPWLPEPVPTDALDPADAAGLGESVTLAFLVVLESLSPAQRVAFVLHDVFGYAHHEVAEMLGRSEPATRQLVSRARRAVTASRPRFEEDAGRRWDVARAFLEAAATGAVGDLVALLAPDVVFTSDGGGLVAAARRPVVGADRVARMVVGLLRQLPEDAQVDVVEVNGLPGAVVRRDNTVDSVVGIDVVEGQVTALRAVRNPAKLGAFTAPAGPGQQ